MHCSDCFQQRHDDVPGDADYYGDQVSGVLVHNTPYGACDGGPARAAGADELVVHPSEVKARTVKPKAPAKAKRGTATAAGKVQKKKTPSKARPCSRA